MTEAIADTIHRLLGIVRSMTLSRSEQALILKLLEELNNAI